MTSARPRLQKPISIDRLFRQPTTHLSLFEDKVFGHGDWEKHRNAAWRHRVEPTVFLRVAIGFSWQLLLVLVVSVGVGLLYMLKPSYKTWLAASHLSTPYTMITFALSLLLVFKTNSSYSRWWEGRIIWGQVVNFGRNYSRQALMWFPSDCPELRAAALRWAMAAPRVLLAHLRQDTTVAAEVQGLLTDDEVEWLRGWANPPLGAGTALGQMVAAAGLPDQLQAELQRQVELYTNCAGGCERIFKTPIPPAYTRHTSRFLMLYLVISPVLLWPSTGWATPAVSVLIAFLLLGVENIGVQVEEPFHVLPLYDICKAIEANIREMERSMTGGRGQGVVPSAGQARSGGLELPPRPRGLLLNGSSVWTAADGKEPAIRTSSAPITAGAMAAGVVAAGAQASSLNGTAAAPTSAAGAAVSPFGADGTASGPATGAPEATANLFVHRYSCS